MTTDSRATALTRFGYTPCQAAFLALVALHGGYFLRRRYATFRGAVDGARVTDLLKRVVQRHHATSATHCHGTKVYHLFAHPLYDALGIGDSRNRRPAPPAAVTFKLMTLDVVLRHRGATFLATEAEKVAYFTTTCGLSQAVLPATCYRSPRSGRSATTRYFVDKAPICLTPPDPTVSIVYLQGWSQTLRDFEAFLLRYRPLLSALPHPRVAFVTTDPSVITEVAAQWPRLWTRTTSLRPRLEASRVEIEAHFRARQRVERKEWATFHPRDLDRYRDDLARFTSPEIDALYRRWCTVGEAALDGLERPSAETAVPLPPLDTELLPFRYPLYPSARRAPMIRRVAPSRPTRPGRRISDSGLAPFVARSPALPRCAVRSRGSPSRSACRSTCRLTCRLPCQLTSQPVPPLVSRRTSACPSKLPELWKPGGAAGWLPHVPSLKRPPARTPVSHTFDRRSSVLGSKEDALTNRWRTRGRR